MVLSHGLKWLVALVFFGAVDHLYAYPPFNCSGPFSFDYLLGENSNFSSDKAVLFVDYLGASESVIRGLRASGKRVICYVNVGAWEPYRPDASSFPASVKGKVMEGWEDERWLDIRQLDVLLPILTARFQVAASKGCEGVDPDNVNGYEQDSGFPLTAADQVVYNRAILQAIHAAGVGMLAGQKNAPELTEELVDLADFAVVEECYKWSECEDYEPFVDAGRPVFAVEYKEELSEASFLRSACAEGRRLGFDFILKKLDLQANYIVTCPAN